MGLELHLQDMLALDKKILCGAAGGADEVRSALTEQMRSVAEVADACSLAQQTLGDLLTFDRIQLGALVMEKAVVSVFPFVSAVCVPLQSRYTFLLFCCLLIFAASRLCSNTWSQSFILV